MSAPDVKIDKQIHLHRTMIRRLWIGAGIAVGANLCVVVFGVDLTGLLPDRAKAVR